MELQRIASFSVDHTRLQKGMYTSRVDGDVVTYDIRMKRPNQGDYLSCGALHTFEHLFATYARSSCYQDGVLYVGPMGCRTGFYLLVRGLSQQQAIDLVRESFAFIAGFEGDIPGAARPSAATIVNTTCPVRGRWRRICAACWRTGRPSDLSYTH